jgi:hypothetical protein
MAEKRIKIAVAAKTLLPVDKLEPFQGDLKRLDKEEYERLRGNILKYGFSFALNVWQNKGHNYIIDGHQRLFTIQQLIKVEGYKCPQLPVTLMDAKSFQEAKEKVLSGASSFGRVQMSGLHKYMVDNNIPFETVVSVASFPEVDFSKFSADFLGAQSEQLPTGNPVPGTLPSGSDGVKMVQLFFDVSGYNDFTETVEGLAERYGTENITDTVLQAVKVAWKAK